MLRALRAQSHNRQKATDRETRLHENKSCVPGDLLGISVFVL